MAANGARVHIYGDWDGTGVKKAQSDLGVFEKNAMGLSGSLSKSFMGVGAALGGAFAIGAIGSNVIDFLQQSMSAAIEDEKSVVALSKAMDNLGLSSKNAMAEDFIKKMMLATGVADDQLRPAFQKLVTATGDVTKAQDLLQLSMDISAATGKDLAAVSQAMAKAASGNVGALTKLGVPLDQSIVKTKDFAGAVEVLTQKFGGQAAAAADTYGGQLARVQVAADEAKETIGYALLDAVQRASESFGGSGGLTQMITSAGDGMANFVTGVSSAVQPVLDLAAGIANLTGAAGDNPFQNMIDMVKFIPIVGQIPMLYDQMATAGAEVNAEQKKINDSLRASEALYAGYTASADAVTTGINDMAVAEERAKIQAERFKTAVTQLTSALSNSQSIDDFKRSLFDLDKTLKGNERSFDGMGKAARENRDTLRDQLGQAASIAQKWVDDGKISADQYQAAYKGLAKKVVNQFVADGFKRKDIEAWLGSQGLWNGPITKNLSAAQKAAVAAGMNAGLAAGKALTDGLTIGIAAGTPGVVHQSGLTMAAAERKAREAAGIASPSKVWAAMGGNLVDGLVVGMKSKDEKVKQAAQDTMQALSDKAGEILAKWDDKLSRLKDRLDERKAELMDAAKSVSSAIMEGLNFGAANDMTTVGENGEQIGMTFMQGLQAQAEQVKTFAARVRELIQAGLSQAGIQQVLAAGMTAGTAIADELIKGGATAISTTNELVSTTQAAADEVGLLAGNSWYGAGVDSAQKLYDGWAQNIGKGGPARVALENLMDRVADSLSRTVTVSVKTVYEAAGIKGARALGGPVTAGDAWLVGEKGPEVFVPSSNGNIIPNGGVSMGGGRVGGGGNTYNITVQAGVGDPRMIGQQVVEYIKRFEQTNGAVFAAA